MKINLTEATMNIVINKLSDLYNKNESRLVSLSGKNLTKSELEEEIYYSENIGEGISEIAGLLGIESEKFEEITEMAIGREV